MHQGKPKGHTATYIRSANDVESTKKLHIIFCSSITEYSVIDCIKLGKYLDSRCHPILATMNRPSDVSQILANRAKLSHISVKPDLSQKKTEILSLFYYISEKT